MKIRESLPEWTIEDSVSAFQIAKSLVDSYDTGASSFPSGCSKRVVDWIRFSSGILKEGSTGHVRLKEHQYVVSKLVSDAIGSLSNQTDGSNAEKLSGDACSGRIAVTSLLFPFIMCSSAFTTKNVANKLIANRRLYERTRGSNLTSILSILLGFRDGLSRQGLYSREETQSICTQATPQPYQTLLSSIPGLGSRILEHMLQEGIVSVKSLAINARVPEKDVRLEIQNLSQTKALPIAIYAGDSRIATFRGPGLHLWQMHDSVEVELNRYFCEDRCLPGLTHVGNLRSIASKNDLSYSNSIESNASSVCSKALGMATMFDSWYLPTEDAVHSGEVLWSYDGLPQFVKLLPKEGKREFLGGAVKFLLSKHRDRFITDDGLNFDLLSPGTSADLYSLLKDDFHILCKRPNRTSCMVYDCGIPELVRNIALSREEILLLMRVFDSDTAAQKISEMRDERLFRQLVSDLLFEKGTKTCAGISDELLMDVKLVEDIISGMVGDMQVSPIGSRYAFSVDKGDLYSFINDSQIRDVMRFE